MRSDSEIKKFTLGSRSFPHWKFILLLVLFISGCSQTSPENKNISASNSTGRTISAANIDLAKPLKISEKPEDVALAGEIEKIIDKSEFSNARWGVFVVSLKNGRVLTARDGRKLFNPASIQKILTSVVALRSTLK